jgi:iron complex outermembrane receptor protein
MKTFRSFPLFLFLTGLAGAQTNSSSAASAANDIHLDNVVVTASPLARAPDEISAPASVLAGAALTQRQQPTLGETLAGLPGVDSTWFGPGASRPVIRGLGGDRIRVLTGGVGTIDASVVSPDHAVSLDPLLIDRVEIIRGPATLLYGGGAIGGVVNVIDGRIPESLPAGPLTGRIELRGDHAAAKRAGAAVLTGAAGRVAWRLDGFRRETGDLRIPGFAETEALRAAEAAEHGETLAEHDAELVRGRLPNSSTESAGAALGFAYIGDHGHLGLAYSGFDTLYGVPGHAHHEEEEAEPAGEEHAEAGVRIDLRQRRLDMHGEWLAPTGLLRAAKIQLGVADYRHEELEGETLGTRFGNEGYEGRLELLHAKLGGFEGALGLQASRSDFRAEGDEAFLPPTVTQNNALFLYEEAVTGAVTWQLGARAERQRITADAGTGLPGRSHSLATFTGGAVWKIVPGWLLTLSLSANERAPNAQELFADGPHAGTGAYELGDPSLGLERSTGLDLSLRKRTGFVTGEISLFLNRFDGYIYEAPTGTEADGLPVFAFVQRDAELRGGEAELTVHLHETKRAAADIRFFADTVRATNTTDGTPLPRTTPVRFGAAVDWRSGLWSLAADWRHVRRQDRTAPDETPTAGYDLVSLGASRRVALGRTQAEIFVRAGNLLDETARVHASFLKDIAPLPGRNASAGLRIAF